MVNGRGAWTKIGMPSNGTEYYQLVTPTNVGSQPQLDQSHRAVMYGVKAIQTRINEMGYSPKLVVDGWLGSQSAKAIIWAQSKVGVAADGQAGPHTLQGLLWPVIQQVAGVNAHTVGGICAHESGFDPGAVGFQDPDDIGLVQINGPANPNLSEAQRFDYRIAYKYCADRIMNAIASYAGKPWTLDAAICSYASPAWGKQWFATGVAPNPAMQAYVDYVKGWKSP